MPSVGSSDGRDADHQRLASAYFALTGATWTIGGVFLAAVPAFHVTPAWRAIRPVSAVAGAPDEAE